MRKSELEKIIFCSGDDEECVLPVNEAKESKQRIEKNLTSK